ncbi:odorant receptor 85b-like [Teleopsis dalmanni]|uniref:odorant receptor 85b-like n=1 Tax=Teleopsis dalmanni TaxID=139649 RepID=UPI0018CD50E8|nr:odorant receptor 85b-like [Teleopsis dalmanni]
MLYIRRFFTRIFPSDPTFGQIGSIDLNIFLAQAAGLPLFGMRNESLAMKIFFSFYGIPTVILITMCYTLFELQELVFSKDLEDVIQCSSLSLSHVAVVIKIYNLFYRLPDIQKVINKLRALTKEYVRSNDQNGEFENKLPLTIYALLLGFTAILAMIMLLRDPKSVAYRYPYRVQLPSFLPQQIQILYMGLSVLVIALQVVATDYLSVILINQLRIHLKILILSFNELINEGQKGSVGIPTLDQNIHLKSIIAHHCSLIELRHEVEDIFRLPILIQFLTSFAIFALSGFQATVSTGNTNITILAYFYCGCILCELFLYCWCGNDVFEQSKEVSTSGYGVSWYKYDQRFQKSLIIFLANAQRPFVFTAGGFMNLSLPSFAGIITKSYSLIALLRQVYGR